MEYKNIIKDIGTWDLVKSTTLDDIAYYLYCSKAYYYRGVVDDNTKIKGVNHSTFKSLFSEPYTYNSPYYEKAQQVLRGEKIERIKKRINGIRR